MFSFLRKSQPLKFADTVPDARWVDQWVGVESTHPLTWLPDRHVASPGPTGPTGLAATPAPSADAKGQDPQAVPPTVNPSMRKVG